MSRNVSDYRAAAIHLGLDGLLLAEELLELVDHGGVDFDVPGGLVGQSQERTLLWLGLLRTPVACLVMLRMGR